MMDIRLATDADYPGIAAVHNAAEPPGAMHDTADGLRHLDAGMKTDYRLRRYVVEDNDEIVATARCSLIPQWYNPQRFTFYIAVHPDRQGHGYGRALYNRIRDDIAPSDPIALRAFYGSELLRSERFLRDRGFIEDMRMWESWIDIDTFDPSPYEPLIESVRQSGIRFRTFADIQQDSGWLQRLYDFIVHIQADMPSPEAYTPMTFEFFKNIEIGRPTIVPEAYFIAVDGDRYVGVTILHKDDSDLTRMNTDDTGVHRAYRRRGIATALKVTGLTWAKEHGIKRVYTMNESTNQPMLALNLKLGFQQMPARVGMILNLT
ncbi:MAG: GNAT family N-acetyltransferase [candidate division Zixibacteria bacterium]|nr:GNAT family N-acetyltransferase [candidate division Zixibacteria bacterium]